ncbi:MAG: choice-of-anchor C family protein [Luteolibacter sp.]
MKPAKLLLITSVMLAAPSARAANIIDSIYGVGAGSFELPGFTGPTFATYASGSTAITGWTVNTVNIDWVKNSVWNASNGSYSLDMNGTPGGPGGIQTVITTTIGSTYRVSFDIAGYLTAGSNTNPKVMKTVAAGITTIHYLTATQSYTQPFALPLAVTWSTRTFDFVATSTSSTVSFVSLVAGDGSAMLLDNVSIEAVPEPGATALVGAGAFCLILRRRRQIPPSLAL